MYEIIINDNIDTLGLITFQIRKEGEYLIKEGMLKTHIYVEEIHTLECNKFKINNVDVVAETIGSGDVFYLYTFTYGDFEIKDYEENYTKEELIALYDKELN
jgi:hypothetical protein